VRELLLDIDAHMISCCKQPSIEVLLGNIDRMCRCCDASFWTRYVLLRKCTAHSIVSARFLLPAASSAQVACFLHSACTDSRLPAKKELDKKKFDCIPRNSSFVRTLTFVQIPGHCTPHPLAHVTFHLHHA